jgi:predicted MFS family arabinose efflux permease
MYSDFSLKLMTPRASWIILGLILLVQILSPMGYYGLSALAPFILEDWGISRLQLGLLLSAFSTGTFLLAYPAGIFTDRIGVRKILIAGQIGVGTFIVLAPWLNEYLLVLSALLLAGLAYGLVNPAGSKAVYTWFPSNRRAAALSLKQISLPLCGVVSGLALPPMAQSLGWRETWMSIGLAVLAGVVITFFVYSDPPVSDAPATHDQGHSSSPLGLLLSGKILRLAFSCFLLTGIQLCWHSYLAIFLKEHLQIKVVVAGTYIALMQGSAIAGRPLLGVLSDSLFGGERRGVLMIVVFAGFGLSLWFAVLPTDAPAWVVTSIVVLFGLTGVGWHGVHLAWMTELASPDTAGAASGLWICSAHLGIILLVPIFGKLVDLSGTFALGWAFTALLYCLAWVSLWWIK